MGIMSKFLMRKYKQGLLPPQMGAQLIHPRQLIMYDTFERPTTTPEQGLGVSDSGHEWTAMAGSQRIVRPGIAAQSGSGMSISTVDIGGLQQGFTIHARMRSSRGGTHNHGILVAYVDPDNYVVCRMSNTNIAIAKFVDGEETILAQTEAINTNDTQSWSDIKVYLINSWGSQVVTPVTAELRSASVSYSLNTDPDAELWSGNIMPGIVFRSSISAISRFYVVDEERTW